MTSNILKDIEDRKYICTDAEAKVLIETQFRAGLVGEKLTDGFYNLLQRRFLDKHPVGATVECQLGLLDEAYKPLYEMVKAVTTTDDVTPKKGDTPVVKKEKALERNKRTNFARGAKATIAYGIKNHTVDEEWVRGELVTKTSIRLSGGGPTPKTDLEMIISVSKRVEKLMKTLAQRGDAVACDYAKTEIAKALYSQEK